MPLLPKNRDHGWAPYAWLVFLTFFFFQPLLDPHTTSRDWVIAVCGTVFFLFLYFTIFRAGKPWTYIALICMTAMGLVLGPINQGSSVFIIFAASFLAWVFETPKAVFAAIAVMLVLLGTDAYFFHAEVGFWATSMVVAVGVGVSNVHFAERQRAQRKLQKAQEEIEHLAKVAERERIARDLHDVLGHTLTLIVVKSALAGKLLTKDLQKAQSEIADIERVSREAMTEIRNTVRGYSAYKLQDEFERSKLVLESAGVNVESQSVDVPLTPAQESVAALIMREAVTNVVRHSRARNCSLRLARSNGNCVLEVHDDGSGGDYTEGNGLRGMRERVEALGGSLVRKSSAGTQLKFEFPLAATAATND